MGPEPLQQKPRTQRFACFALTAVKASGKHKQYLPLRTTLSPLKVQGGLSCELPEFSQVRRKGQRSSENQHEMLAGQSKSPKDGIHLHIVWRAVLRSSKRKIFFLLCFILQGIFTQHKKTKQNTYHSSAFTESFHIMYLLSETQNHKAGSVFPCLTNSGSIYQNGKA